MKKQPDEEILETLDCRQIQQSEQLKPLVSLYIQDTAQKRESRDCTRFKNVVVPIFGTGKIVRSISLRVKDNLTSPPLALLQPRSKSNGKRKTNSGDRAQWVTTGACMLSRR